jgi:tRNA pseudouridine13 synthase
MKLPYFIPTFSGIGGVLKERPSDFVVHELPAYDPCGEGEHVLVEIEKSGLSTFDAIEHVSRKLKVPRRDIGYAGLKDTNAVTRQWMSVRGVTPEAVNDVASDKIKVLFADRHRNKLRVGHLRGNRFSVKVRQTDPMKVVTLTPVLKQLANRGMPNYFGEQRFGRRNQNHLLGAALLSGDLQHVLKLLLGSPQPELDSEEQSAARIAFEQGNLSDALEKWPRRDREERATLVRLKDGKTVEQAVAAIDVRVRELWLSAFQSHGFNAVVAKRIASIDQLIPGDIAFKHENGACFAVEDAEAERPRATAFEISPTGPLVGPRMAKPQAQAASMEKAALIEVGLNEDAIDTLYSGVPVDVGDSALSLPGARRPIRVRPTDLSADGGMDEHGPYIHVSFCLPPGAYATVLMRELMRNDTA